MGLIKRMSNMFRAKVNSRLDEIENPIELLDQKLKDMENSLNKAKLSSAQVLGSVYEIKKNMESAKKTSLEFDEKVKLALNKNNEELAKKALEKKLEAENTYKNLEKSYKTASIKAETIKKKLIDLENEIKKTRIYRDEAAARYNNAEASKKINEILTNIDSENNKISIDDIEKTIQKKEAISRGLEDLKELNSLDKEFEELDKIDLDKELEKYKQN
ncbi:PspA/IM30 family protein [Clostridium sp. cel8]|uniref:PspA/IM30 family protein n=1 Tax=Clostridium sp. cel8 TaxID=2663123 RepID=UPI0015F4410B|nr:PspA/IM30 family protein [Clostridium sp. cel8]MBA5851412.1 PspA/IM30 family protein [Clostridium sp. cel8]